MQPFSDEQTIVLDNAVRRITDILAIDEFLVAQILGFDDDARIAYLNGQTSIDGSNKIMVGAALQIIELYTLLETMLNDDESVRKWLNADNVALASRPIELITTPEGLNDLLTYARTTVHG